jgi:hypothetical protein
MNSIGKGIVAGFLATVLVSILMLIKAVIGLMPEVNVIAMLGGMIGGGPTIGWIAHFLIGAVFWGTLFALLQHSIPVGRGWPKGVLFSVAAWLLMMLAVMPIAGAGFFGMRLGLVAPVMTLIIHVIFGAVLGGIFAALQIPPKRMHRHAHM